MIATASRPLCTHGNDWNVIELVTIVIASVRIIVVVSHLSRTQRHKAGRTEFERGLFWRIIYCCELSWRIEKVMAASMGLFTIAGRSSCPGLGDKKVKGEVRG